MSITNELGIKLLLFVKIEEKCFVLVGRDATTVIAPDAEVKFFINAAFDARVKRRWLNFKKKENSFKTLINKLNVSKPNYPFKNDPFYQKIKTEMKKRDENDRNRKIGSLKIALDAFEINNTFLDFTQTLKLMLQLIEQQNFTLPKVTIIGQSNVGKSTLFNRLAGKNTVLISQIANTTRDFYSKRITVKNRNFILVDTGGLTETSNFLEKEIAERTEAVINQSDWLFWVVDFNQPLNLIDLRINKLIKYHKNKTVLIINKAEKFTNKDQIKNFNQLGIKTQIPLSTKTKLNFSELLNWIEKNISGQEKEEESEKTNQILLFGKTNVGKSSLFNALCRKKRVIVSNQRHTTTNVVEEKILYQNHHLSFIDSAGIRKKRTKAQTIEKKAKIQILKYLKWIDLVLFVCDASQELTVQDKKMIDLILQFDKKFIIVGNKSDLIKENKNKIEQSIKAFFPFIKKQNISIFLVSSLKSYGVFTNLLEKILQILELK